MTVPTDRKYPARATNAAWQKQKSFLDKAKAKTKTGLGEKLAKAEAEWALIRWAQLDAATLTPKNSPEAAANRKAAAGALMGVQQTRRLLGEAQAEAGKQAANKALSKPAQAAAKQIATDLGQAYQRLDQVNLDDFDAAIKRLEDAKQELADVEIYNGNVLLGSAPKATHDHTTVVVPAVTWKVPANARLGLLGQKLSVRATAGDRTLFVEDMTFKAEAGNKLTFQS